jgi:hypothetical protein
MPRENIPQVKLHRCKKIYILVYPKLNVNGDKDLIIFKWGLLYIYCLPNMYQNEDEFVGPVILRPAPCMALCNTSTCLCKQSIGRS